MLPPVGDGTRRVLRVQRTRELPDTFAGRDNSLRWPFRTRARVSNKRPNRKRTGKTRALLNTVLDELEPYAGRVATNK